MEPSPCSDPMNRGASSNKIVTMVLITDCPTLTVHARKCHKALIDSGTAISLVRYSTYQNIDENVKTAIQSTSIHLNTADGLPMTALGITPLQLWIANSHTISLYVIGYPLLKYYLACTEEICTILCLGPRMDLLHSEGG